MGMTYEEKKKVVEAAKLIQLTAENAIAEGKGCCYDCFFCDFGKKNCMFGKGKCPISWEIPKITRWTPEDVALAKALKGFGVYIIQRWTDNELVGRAEDGLELVFLRRDTMFKAFDTISETAIDTIIKEAEG